MLMLVLEGSLPFQSFNVHCNFVFSRQARQGLFWPPGADDPANVGRGTTQPATMPPKHSAMNSGRDDVSWPAFTCNIRYCVGAVVELQGSAGQASQASQATPWDPPQDSHHHHIHPKCTPVVHTTCTRCLLTSRLVSLDRQQLHSSLAIAICSPIHAASVTSIQ